MTDNTVDGFRARLADWAVTVHNTVFAALHVEPPEVLALALWVLWTSWDLTFDELHVFAELIVCRDGPSIHSAVFEPGDTATVATTGWHRDCIHEPAEERVCSAAPDDIGSDAYKRRADLVAQWKAAVLAVNDANGALGKPLMECDSAAAYRDGAVIHSMLALERDRVGCRCKEHQAAIKQLITLVTTKTPLSPAPSPEPQRDGGDTSVNCDTPAGAKSCDYGFMTSGISSKRATQRRTKFAKERQRLAAAVQERVDLVRRLRSVSPWE